MSSSSISDMSIYTKTLFIVDLKFKSNRRSVLSSTGIWPEPCDLLWPVENGYISKYHFCAEACGSTVSVLRAPSTPVLIGITRAPASSVQL